MYIKNIKNPSTHAAYMNEQGVFDLLFTKQHCPKSGSIQSGETILLYQDLGTQHGLCFTHIVMIIDPKVYPHNKYPTHPHAVKVDIIAKGIVPLSNTVINQSGKGGFSQGTLVDLENVKYFQNNPNSLALFKKQIFKEFYSL